MIRLANPSDLPVINNLGLLISSNFKEKNNLEERITLDYVDIYVYEDECIIKGFIEIEIHFEVIDIINIAVSEEFQKNGIAKEMLDYVIKNRDAEKLILEVNANNMKAISFYKTNNFIEINRRRKYYGDNDAIVMERSII